MNQHKIELTLNEIKQHLDNKVFDQKEILNITEAASFLRIAKSTLYKLTHRKSIPFHKPTGRILFKRKELITWLESSDPSVFNLHNSKKKEVSNANQLSIPKESF